MEMKANMCNVRTHKRILLNKFYEFSIVQSSPGFAGGEWINKIHQKN